MRVLDTYYDKTKQICDSGMLYRVNVSPDPGVKITEFHYNYM